MPWCPKCKTEYMDGFNICSDCGSELVEQPEKETYDHEVYLTTAVDQMEADLLEALLISNNIPVLRKYRENGAYLNIYMGNPSTGIDIFVPSSSIEAAKKIIDTAQTENIIPDQQDEELTNAEQTIQKKRSFRAWIYLVFIFGPVLLGVVAGIFVIIQILLNKY